MPELNSTHGIVDTAFVATTTAGVGSSLNPNLMACVIPKQMSVAILVVRLAFWLDHDAMLMS